MRRPLSAAALVAFLLAVCCGCSSLSARSDPTAPATSAPVTTPAPRPRPTGPATTIAVLGDSLSRGFDACDHYGDCPSVSWAGGTDPRIDSLAARLGEETGGPVHVRNVAVSGSTVSDLDRQVSEALPAQPDLVTVLIGANDVCRASLEEMTSTADYAAAVRGALDRIAAGAPTATILIASVPDVTALLPAAANDPTARFLWSHAGGCATALADPQSNDIAVQARRAAVVQRIAEYNTVLAGACVAIEHCVYDGGALNAYRPSLRQLSALDRFHPSITGLHELARLEWGALTGSDRAAPLLNRAG